MAFDRLLWVTEVRAGGLVLHSFHQKRTYHDPDWRRGFGALSRSVYWAVIRRLVAGIRY